MKNINKNETIDIFFLVIHHETWKLESVYNNFKSNKIFNPIILICPYTSAVNDEVMFSDMANSYDYFRSKNYNVIHSLHNNSWLDINDISSNKIIFFTNPHNITHHNYLWKNFPNELKYYVPYHHQIDAGQWNWQWKSQFHLSMTKLFYIDQYHLEVAQKIMANYGENVVITGYPAVEKLYSKTYKPQSVWKPQPNKKKRIIYAPHHTINFTNETGVSEFLNLSQIMIDMAIKYKDSIQFAFKPHPILKHKLYNHPDWGVEKTNKYYYFWENTDNTQLEEGQYIDLFLGSDALIHDSGSFLAEYLYLKKPVMYLINNTTLNRFNDYGLKCLENCHTSNNNDVDTFLMWIIDNIDQLKESREKFVNERLIPKQKLASKLIYEQICNDIANIPN